MEAIKPNPILKYNKKQLTKVRKSLGYEDVKVLKKDIKDFHDWIQKQNQFKIKEFDESYLERWIIFNKGSVDRAKQKFEKLYIYTNSMPEFLQHFDIKNEFHAVQAMTNNVVLPMPTSDNFRVLITHLTGEYDKNFAVIQAARYYIVVLYYMLYKDYCVGFDWIADTRLLTWSLILKLNPNVLRKSIKIFVDALVRRIRRIHLLSGSKLFNIALIVFKQGLSAKLKERIIIHQNVESLYEYFPKEQLPKELGGYERSMKEINDAVFQELCSDEFIAQVKFMELVTTDESKKARK